MKRHPKFSIVIPFYVKGDRFFEDLKKFENLNYKNYEILVVSDQKINFKIKNARLVLTHHKHTGPAEKRDIALKVVKGEYCAFIDDDAYPDKDWLKNAADAFKDKKVGAVGGPGLTPPEDDYWAQLTGLVYGSYFCGGQARHRFVKEKKRYVVDFPAYNLIVRTKLLKEVGGYGSYFYGGEDTFLCLKIIKTKYKILYDPKVFIYHHRRDLFVPYLKQIGNIGKHRGYFAKKFPETSRTLSYFLPSILTLGLFGGWALSIFNPVFKQVYLQALIFFVLLGALSVIKKTNLANALIVSIAIILTHVVYGLNFIRGLFTKKLYR